MESSVIPFSSSLGYGGEIVAPINGVNTYRLLRSVPCRSSSSLSKDQKQRVLVYSSKELQGERLWRLKQTVHNKLRSEASTVPIFDPLQYGWCNEEGLRRHHTSPAYPILSSMNTFQQDELKRPEKEGGEKGFG